VIRGIAPRTALTTSSHARIRPGEASKNSMCVTFRFVGCVFGAWLLSCALGSPAAAATIPPGFSESLIASGLQNPTAMAFAPDGRLFVCEQNGALRVIRNGVLLTTPFTRVTVNSSGERGLLGVAFDPDFAVNGYVYVYYTATTPVVHNRVSRFTAVDDVAQDESETVLLDLEPLGATNHNGGAIHFGVDGKLYVAVGENAVSANAQTLSNRLGKILRLNADGTIPTDNPFYDEASGVNRAIWALGLRNPFTFAVRPIAGTLFINDVGEGAWEEINVGMAGANYGWPATEGPTSNPSYRGPLHAYSHADGCAIAGGAFHNPLRAQFPLRYWGAYFFADLCGGWIRVRSSDGTVEDFASGISQPVDLASAADGSLYYLARGTGGTTGTVHRIAHDAIPPALEVTANGGEGPLSLVRGNPLRIDVSFDAGPGGSVGPAEMYAGVATPSGVFWADPLRGLVVTPTPVYSGPLPSFGPLAFVDLPDASAIAPGLYWWFVIVDRDANAVPDGDISDVVLTVVR
jgi:glucose/arabinose dehydrogenase